MNACTHTTHGVHTHTQAYTEHRQSERGPPRFAPCHLTKVAVCFFILCNLHWFNTIGSWGRTFNLKPDVSSHACMVCSVELELEGVAASSRVQGAKPRH